MYVKFHHNLNYKFDKNMWVGNCRTHAVSVAQVVVVHVTVRVHVTTDSVVVVEIVRRSKPTGCQQKGANLKWYNPRSNIKFNPNFN